MTEYMCKNCGQSFQRWTTVQNLCGKCQYNRYAKPAKPIKKVGKIAKKWIEYRKDWFKRNPEPYNCYICGIYLTVDTATLDHVLPRSGNPELRFVDSNIKPACFSCNQKKGSKRL